MLSRLGPISHRLLERVSDQRLAVVFLPNRMAYPYDRSAFIQGSISLDGYLYESTGQYGQSS
jgi:glutamine cyclotransferase